MAERRYRNCCVGFKRPPANMLFRSVRSHDESEVMLDRHAAYFEALAERAHAQRWHQDKRGLDELGREHDNLRAALDHLHSVDARRALRLAGGRGKTTVCATCHGQDLKGVGDVPPLVGRSPSYTVRQLYDFQSGARAGLLSPLMKESVAKLTIEDMVAIAAFTASRTP